MSETVESQNEEGVDEQVSDEEDSGEGHVVVAFVIPCALPRGIHDDPGLEEPGPLHEERVIERKGQDHLRLLPGA